MQPFGKLKTQSTQSMTTARTMIAPLLSRDTKEHIKHLFINWTLRVMDEGKINGNDGDKSNRRETRNKCHNILHWQTLLFGDTDITNINAKICLTSHSITNTLYDIQAMMHSYLEGYEIGVHTVTHITSVNTDITKWYYEIKTPRDFLSIHAVNSNNKCDAFFSLVILSYAIAIIPIDLREHILLSLYMDVVVYYNVLNVPKHENNI